MYIVIVTISNKQKLLKNTKQVSDAEFLVVCDPSMNELWVT
jgi:hypothetical protein